MKIKLTAAEAVQLTQLQGETIAAREHYQSMNAELQAAMGRAWKRAGKDEETVRGKMVNIKVDGQNVYLEVADTPEKP